MSPYSAPATLEETGIQWPDDEVDWESLQIAMTQEATLGKDGKLGGWPALESFRSWRR